MARIGEMVPAKGLTPNAKLAQHRAEFTTKVEALVESIGEAKSMKRQAIIVLQKLQRLAVEVVNSKTSYSIYDHSVVIGAIKDVKETINA